MTTIQLPLVPTDEEIAETTDWDAAPLVDTLPEHIQAGRRSWREVTLAEAWAAGYRGGER